MKHHMLEIKPEINHTNTRTQQQQSEENAKLHKTLNL